MQSSGITIGVFSIAHIDRSRIGGIIMMRETLLGIQQIAQTQQIRVVVVAESLAVDGSLPPAWEQIDGWLSIFVTKSVATIMQAGTPVVLINAIHENLPCPTVLPDNRGGVATAVRHLIGHGHRRIAFLGTMDVIDVVERYEGYTTALAEHGIAIDPTIVFDVPDDLVVMRQMIREWFSAPLGFSAIFTTNDINAQIVLEELHASGYQVPEQVAVVGFDDMEHAQHTNPPLTTIRQQFYENGRVATRLLLDRIAGRPIAATTYVPTALIIRNSCGCAPQWDSVISLLPLTVDEWQARLVPELVRLLRYPLPIEEAVPPTTIWPGSMVVLRALAAAVAGEAQPTELELAQAWEQAAQLTADLENILRIMALLDRTGAHFSANASDPATILRVNEWLNQARLGLLRAHTARQQVATSYAEQLIQMNYAVSKALIDRSGGEAQQLGWLAYTGEIWGCLALWDGQASEQTTLTIVGAYTQHQQHHLPLGRKLALTAFPPAEWLPDLAAMQNNVVKLLPVRTAARDWGVLALCGPIELHPNTPMLAMLLGSALERDTLVASLAEQQETLRVAHEHQLITEHTHDLLSMLDTTGRYRYASPSFQHRLGYDPATLVGSSIFDFVHAEDRPSLVEQWFALTVHDIIQATVRYRHANESWRWIELSGTMIDRHGGPAVVLVGRDISERRRLEEQLAQAYKMETVGQLAGGVAHDFNNLLTVIGGYTDVVRATVPSNNTVQDDLEEIQKAVERAHSLTRQLLAFARQQIIEPQVLNLNTLISDVAKLLRRLIGEHIELQTILATDPGYITADPHQIEQLLINLAVNARDAMPGGGTLTIATSHRSIDSSLPSAMLSEAMVLLQVRDTGVGMSAEVKQHLFEPFFTTKGVGKGTGLGLATCYGIVRQHNGQITIESEVGQGTNVQIAFPQVSDPLGERLSSLAATIPVLVHGGETILLVEDETTLRTLAGRVLRSYGYKVLETTDGLDAMRAVQAYHEQIHLLLTDVVMPHMGGVALVKEMLGLYPQLKVLFTSGYTDSALAHQGQLDPGIHLLQKPFSPAALARKVREVLDS